MCGGSLEVEKGQTICECEYCGTKQTVSSTDDEITTNLYNRANNLRMKSEFDKAQEIYEKIITKAPNEAEAYWGVILCKYGIEYVEDPDTYKKVPTCHRTQLESVLTDVDYLSAIEKADSNQKLIYEQEAKKIDKLQKDILAIVHNEKPFDVFICYKETDESGKRTVDSALANDIYYQLTQEGLKVFYAAITLENKLGQEYEPYIFSALNSARVMLVVGTKPENFNSVWVKNEWSRYLKLMKNDRSKTLIPCFRDMDAYDLPDEFSHLQAQDMGKIGFINDVVRGIKKLITPTKTQSESTVVVESSNIDTAPLLKRAFLFLEDGKWQDADEYCERVLDIDPENAQAYLGKLMAELRVRKQEQLAECEETFENNGNYQKALRFGSKDFQSTLKNIAEQNKLNTEKIRLTKIYNNAIIEMNNADTENSYKAVAEKFKAIDGFKDADELARQCFEKADVCRKERLYSYAKSNMDRKNIASYEEAIKVFGEIQGWKDSEEQICTCQKKIEEMKVAEERRLLKEKHIAENLRIAKEKRKKNLKKLVVVTSSLILVWIVFAIMLRFVIIPYNTNREKENKYNEAISLIDSGNIVEAYEELIALDGYKDSIAKADEIFDQYKKEKLKVVEVGDYIFFGSYEQDNDLSNGKKNVEWLVLEVKDGKALVVSKYALDCKQYNTSKTDVTWETCTLRKWLNNDFIDDAFSMEEKLKIPTVTVSADENPNYSTNPGNATQDRVFLLSITEVDKYFSTDIERVCDATDYALTKGAYHANGSNKCWWWLRSSGQNNKTAAYCGVGLGVNMSGIYVESNYIAVRPAMWINLS